MQVSREARKESRTAPLVGRLSWRPTWRTGAGGWFWFDCHDSSSCLQYQKNRSQLVTMLMLPAASGALQLASTAAGPTGTTLVHRLLVLSASPPSAAAPTPVPAAAPLPDSRAALVVVDMQRDFVEPGAPLFVSRVAGGGARLQHTACCAWPAALRPPPPPRSALFAPIPSAPAADPTGLSLCAALCSRLCRAAAHHQRSHGGGQLGHGGGDKGLAPPRPRFVCEEPPWQGGGRARVRDSRRLAWSDVL